MKVSGKAGHSSYSVLFLIFILGGAAGTAIFISNVEERTQEKRRIRKQMEESTQALIEENYQNVSTTIVSKASSPEKVISTSEPVKSLARTNKTASMDNSQPKASVGGSSQPANIAGYIPITRSSNVSRAIPVKNAKTPDVRRIAFP